MSAVWFGFKIGVGIALASAGIAAIAALMRNEYERRKSALYQVKKIRRLIDRAQEASLLSKRLQVMGLKERLKSTRTAEDKTRLQEILNEQTIILEGMLKKQTTRERNKLPNLPDTKEGWYEAMRIKLGDEKWAKEKSRFDMDWKQLEKLL